MIIRGPPSGGRPLWDWLMECFLPEPTLFWGGVGGGGGSPINRHHNNRLLSVGTQTTTTPAM